MQLKISHTTRYSYDQPVNYALQKIRLRPYDTPQQTVTDWSLDIVGGKKEAAYNDHYGNCVELISAEPNTTKIEITAHGTIETHETAGVLGKVYGCAPLWHFMQETALTKAGRGVVSLSKKIGKMGDPITDLHALSDEILKRVPYVAGQTGVDTTVEEAIKIGAGVCQDHAQIFIAAVRNAGFPARYVSGYLMINNQVDQDASHGWAEVHLESLGWVGFDVSNGISPDSRYVRLAIGQDASQAAPISGMRLGSGRESMIVSLQVQQ
jgi:transglutaminase-like putative cysteine protease